MVWKNNSVNFLTPSFPRRRESSTALSMDSRLRGNDGMVFHSASLPGCVTKPIFVNPARRAALMVSATDS